MNRIQLNKNKIIALFSSKGNDSKLYLYENDAKLLKIFKKLPTEQLDNKRRKIEQLKELQSDIELLDLVYSGDDFIGYTMKRYDYNNLSSFTSKKEKIKHLKMLKDKVEDFNKKGIFIGNFNETNLLLSPDKKNIKICAIDNLKVDDIDFDIETENIRRYKRKGANPEFIDSYCFNMFTLAYFAKYAAGYFDIYDFELPREFRTYENEKILYDMKHLTKNYKKDYFIDHLK